MTIDPIVSARLSEAKLEPAPIRPEWILEGTPRARAVELSRTTDGAALTAVWDCTAGTFNWYFGGDEVVHILDGEVVVDDGRGARVLRPGDVALFRAGTWARWRVPRYVRKLAFCHDALPRPVSLWLKVTRKLGRLRVRLTRRGASPAGPLAAGVPAANGAAASLLNRLGFLAIRSVSFGSALVL